MIDAPFTEVIWTWSIEGSVSLRVGTRNITKQNWNSLRAAQQVWDAEDSGGQ